ncbi:HTH_XRE domain containing protein [uncultured Caudovirales phage]|uniref:HTH_XRE domain containing protein n=1 Tax=uncultured Caudovirales phage TaxID=2100421 RepID=A0A6J5KQV6_9CAUD|nr:HTH_XRE domain containing protein [uncultured Caudovirales phage]CAB4123615.1 HTH_XRE domain containing protein [uncultured Caudovirales phage]
MSPTKPIPRGEVEIELGERFRRVRKSCGMSLAELSLGLKCSINTLRWHEAGARPLRVDEIVRSAEIMGCVPNILIVSKRRKNDPAIVA